MRFNKDLLLELIKTSFKLRYNNSILGFIWVLLKPFLQFCINLVVWTNVLKIKTPDFPLWLLSGMLLYTLFTETTLLGMRSLLEKAGIILKVNFNRIIAVLSSTSMAVINFIINMAMFFIIFLIYKISNGQTIFINSNILDNLTSLLFGLVIAIVVYLLGFALGMFLSIIMTRFRDMEHIVELFFQILAFTMPLYFPIAAINDERFKLILANNPLGMLISAFRSALIEVQTVNLIYVFVMLIVSICLLYTSYAFFKVRVKAIAEFF